MALVHLGTIGLIAVTVLGAGSLLVIWWLSRRELVGHHNAISDVDGAGLAVSIPSKKERRKAARAKRRELEAQQVASGATKPEPAGESATEPAGQATGQATGPATRATCRAPAAAGGAGTGRTCGRRDQRNGRERTMTIKWGRVPDRCRHHLVSPWRSSPSTPWRCG